LSFTLKIRFSTKEAALENFNVLFVHHRNSGRPQNFCRH
jgi:hypothetical protein